MAFKIIVRGDASTNAAHLSDVVGIDCQDDFADYFDNDVSFVDDVTDGYMTFESNGLKLFTVVTYNSTRELNEVELEELLDYTIGQLSDGIGEGFEQTPIAFGEVKPESNEIDDEDEDDSDFDDDFESEIYVSPWSSDSEYTITQSLNN